MNVQPIMPGRDESCLRISRPHLQFVALVLISLIAYLPALRGDFLWDDDQYIVHNIYLRDVSGLIPIWFSPGSTPQYYPLTFTTFWIEYQLFGLAPLAFHVTNVLLHAFTGFLFAKVLSRLRVPGVWLAAVLFVLHPVHAESVAWITERKNVLSAVFYLASMLCLMRFYDFDGDERPANRAFFYSLALLAFVGALFSKTVTCTLPAAFLLLLWWKQRVYARGVLALVPFFVLGVAMGLLTAQLEAGPVGAADVSVLDLSIAQRLVLAGQAYWFYVANVLLPFEYVFIYPRWEIFASPTNLLIYPATACVSLLALFFLRHRVGKGPVVAVLIFAGTLFPTLGFFRVYFMQFSWVADHFQYHANMALIALAAALITRLFSSWPRRKTSLNSSTASESSRSGNIGIAFFPFVLVLPLGMMTWKQAGNYSSLERLWLSVLDKNPTAWIAHNNLGLHYKQQSRWDEAELCYREALRIKDDIPEAASNLGAILAQRGEFEEALPYLWRAIRLAPEHINYHTNLAATLARMGRDDEAVEAYREVVRLQPESVDFRTVLAGMMIKVQRWNEAYENLERVLQNVPDHPGANALMAELRRKSREVP